jgi:hypothetical protein
MARMIRLAAALGLAGAGAYVMQRLGRDKPGASERERISYPPLDTLKEVAPGVWIVDSTTAAAGLALPIRMTVLRLADGGLLLHSPTPITAALRVGLEQLGTVRHLVAPTIAHWTFLPDWQQAFPGAAVWAVPGLRDRAQVRASGLRIDHDLGHEAPQAWVEEIQQGLVEGGAGFTEAYFFHRPSRTLVLVDLIQNLEPEKLPPASGLLARAAQATIGRTAAHVRLVTRLGGARAREQIRRIVALEPERVIFAHGDWFAAGASERLKRAFDWML